MTETGGSNFKDPVGLLLRMLRSGNRAAYGALFREAFRIGVRPIDALLKKPEQRRREQSSPSDHPVLLII
ncbi:MAG: hypothetical protein KDA89_23150, partial [Planctomycetaceae bacterium]|nr:hypothetical protein [Planctomycetaceae bacterium]